MSAVDLAHYAVNAVLVEGRSVRAVAGATGTSKSWVQRRVQLFRAGGAEALEPRRRGPKHAPALTAPEVEDEIVWWRKHLGDAGFDAGARTIRYHLSQAHQSVPSLSTVHRVLRRRGLVLDQPQKRPRSSWVRFEAALANECWQSDMTHWHVGEDKVEILHFIDDCSRAVLSSKVVTTASASDTVELFYATAATWGLPASVLSTMARSIPRPTGVRPPVSRSTWPHSASASSTASPTIPRPRARSSATTRPSRSGCCAHDEFGSIGALEHGVEFFANYYNEIRPHQAHGRPPMAVYKERDKATPSIEGQALSPVTKVRRDRVDTNGTVTLRHRSKLHHIGVGRAHCHQRVLMLVADLDIRILDAEGSVLRHLTLDPSKDYQPIR